MPSTAASESTVRTRIDSSLVGWFRLAVALVFVVLCFSAGLLHEATTHQRSNYYQATSVACRDGDSSTYRISSLNQKQQRATDGSRIVGYQQHTDGSWHAYSDGAMSHEVESELGIVPSTSTPPGSEEPKCELV